MESVYLETTVVSYLVARPSRDVIVAGHQQTTQQWWNERKNRFECFVSQIVIDEATLGDATESAKRQAAMRDMAVLEVNVDAKALVKAIMQSGALPPKAVQDAGHIAVSAIHEIDYLLTWNCRHLANAQVAKRIRRVCERHGWQMPTICTPEELMGDE